MKKTISVLLSVVMLVSVFAVSAFAADHGVDFATTLTDMKVCPGSAITSAYNPQYALVDTDVVVDEAAFYIKVAGADEFVKYDGTLLDETFNGAKIKFVVTSAKGAEEYADETATVTLTVAHNPTGAYLHNATSHWKVCADCGKECANGMHVYAIDEETGDVDNYCSICGTETLEGFIVVEDVFDDIVSVGDLGTGLIGMNVFETVFSLLGTVFALIPVLLGGGGFDIGSLIGG